MRSMLKKFMINAVPMRVIELLGPSGVGKTFLYQRLFEVHTERHYMNVAEACIKAAGELRLVSEFSRQYLYYLLLKSGLCGFKALGLSRSLLLSQEDFFYAGDKYGMSFDLLKRYLSAEQNLSVFSQRIANFKRCVQLNFVLEKHLSKDATVFFDEGVLHYHHGLNQSAMNHYTANEMKKDKAVNPLAVVSCELSFDQTMGRILNRKLKGIHTFSHKRLSDKDLATYVRRNISEYQQKIDALRVMGTPVLILQTDDSVSVNLNAIHSFINNLI